MVEPDEWVSAFLETFQEITGERGLLPQEIQVKKDVIFDLLEPVTSELCIELSLTDSLEMIEDAQEYVDNLSMDDPVMQIFESMMEDESFRALVESGKL